MGLCTIVPVQEAFQIDDLANLQVTNSLICAGTNTAQIGLDTEGVLSATNGNIEVQIVALSAGAIPLIQECIAGIVGSHNSSALDGNKHIHVVSQIFSSQQISNIQSLCHIGAIGQDLVSCIDDFDFACILSLVTGYTDMGTDNHLVVVFLAAQQLIQEVSTIGILGVDGCTALAVLLPPTLLSLHEGFNHNLGVQIGSSELSIGHNTFALSSGIELRTSGIGGVVATGSRNGFLTSSRRILVVSTAGLCIIVAANESQHNSQSQNQRDKLFHGSFSF